MTNRFHGRTETSEILEIEIEKIWVFGEQGLRLSWVPAQDGDLEFPGVTRTFGGMVEHVLGGDGGEELGKLWLADGQTFHGLFARWVCGGEVGDEVTAEAV